VKVDFVFENGIGSDNPNVKKMMRATPAICRILKIKEPPKHIQFIPRHFGWFGGFNPVSKEIIINVGGLERALVNKNWRYWERLKHQLSPWKPDIFIHTLAHEFQHLKQSQEGRLVYLGDGSSADFLWKGQPLNYFTGIYNGKVKGYQRLPSEIEANRMANYVTKELHREKYLYP